ncbi:hypothetical protein [Massilia glaciei]|uniref:Uncharacterized protein n=1 Tax=Massilia glaciei TaxID=1524097 RepID=A0A2U2I7C7_9BURK|nr:hypothetical protein [Massilia glaciei]PWF55646.1 hypothetical protein C7C56_000830 [Massilia glaciei]
MIKVWPRALAGNILASALGLLLAASAAAGPLTKDETPAPLRPWTEWVLHENTDRACPYFYNDSETRRCSWPASIELVLDAKGGSFEQTIQVYKPLWVALPGNAEFWPLEVKIGGKAAVVTAKSDMPGVTLPIGAHRVTGSFRWAEMPETLQLPVDTALVALRLDDRVVAAPKLADGGQLWLQSRAQDSAVATDRLEMRVSRKLSDNIPFVVTTELRLTVSGKNREVLIPTLLLPGTVPAALTSELPARIEPDGSLRIQLRPGDWSVSLEARHLKAPAALTLPAGAQPLVAEEVWVFEAHNQLRVVSPQGSTPIDAKQAVLPDEWKHLPAFRIKPGESLKLVESKRGNPDPGPDQLGLRRTIWLDFDGGGYTMHDDITGNLSRSWRLEMANPGVLGRVTIDNEDQFITRQAADPGVELRTGKANIGADSRIESGTRAFSATGWRQDFQTVSAQLHLPPGWRLFAASGTDATNGSWVSKWTLLDMFVVLIIGLAFGKLWSPGWGLAALLTLALIYHEPNAPRWIWLAVLAGVALLKVLPLTGRAWQAVRLYRALALLALALWMLPFSVTQIRQALYPVLEIPAETSHGMTGRSRQSLDEAAEAAPAAADGETQAIIVEEKIAQLSDAPVAMMAPPPLPPKDSSSYVRAESGLDKLDPNAIVQTGPGLPRWSWRSYELVWNGPVEQDAQLRLWLLPPALVAFLCLLRVLLLALLFGRLMERPLAWPRLKRAPSAAAALLAVLLAAPLLAPPDAHASEPVAESADKAPPADMLEELKRRLLLPADCQPNCVELSRMQIQARGASLQLRLEVHALDHAAVNLPGAVGQWQAQTVLLDGKPASAMVRDDTGTMWLALPPGVHEIVMQGDIGALENVLLPLHMKPRRVDTSLEGWTVSGLRENGRADANVQLTRTVQNTQAGKGAAAVDFPPFVRVTRTITLGLRWTVHTVVERIAPANGPIQVEVALLPGESLTSSEPRIVDGKAMVSLSPQSGSVSWQSSLKERPVLALKAAAGANQIELWRLDAGKQWHVVPTGVPAIEHQDGSARWMPLWRPWPGEQVTLAISKPLGVAGQTLTMDESTMTVTPGERSSSVALRISLRASRGGLHPLTLPENAILEKVSVGDTELPLRLDGRILRVPLQSGEQEVRIDWRQPGGVSTFYRTPEVDPGLASVNATIMVHMPQDRWTMLLGGPRMGPAVLLWGLVLVIGMVALALGRSTLTPLKSWHWFLLGLGLTQVEYPLAIVIVGWLLALGYRRQYGALLGDRRFKLAQVLLVVWTLAALAGLFVALTQTLIGFPNMQVAGNLSDRDAYRWFADRMADQLPQAWIISLPLLAYRLLMLLWCLWLAYALLSWLKWGWSCFSEQGYWRAPKPKPIKGDTPEDLATAEESTGAPTPVKE